MMLKLLKSYNLLFLLPIALLLLGSTSLYAQEGNAANFSVYGDLYSGTPVLTSPLADDWFQGTTGNGMINQSQTAAFRTITNNRENTAFTARSPYNQYKELNGFLLYDAVYGRDHVDFGSKTGGRDKSAFVGNAGKNASNPNSTWDLGTDETVGNSVDLVDVYAHLRRAGVSVGTNMWLTMGVATISNTGSHYVDFELYASPIALNGDKTKFINSGPNNKGGHTPWELNAAGNVTSSGDMIAAFEFNNASVSNVILRIWTSYTTWRDINPVNFNWGGFEAGSNGYGYAEILIPSSGVKSKGSSSNVTGPPWGTFYDNESNPITSIYRAGYFAEVGINLSSLGIDPSLASGNPCDAPFTKLLVKSRSSASFTSTLKDYAGPYNFLGSSVVDTRIATSQPKFSCAVSAINLSPQNPQTGSYYYWTTADGQFADGTKFSAGANATAVKPGTYRLAAAPLEGCTESFDELRIYAAPCAYDDSSEVIENNGSVVINILANDVDLDNQNTIDTKGNLDPTSVKNASLKKPDNGTVVINPATGAMTYTPFADFYGVDTFEYQVFDLTPTGSPYFGPYSDVAMVTVNVLRDSDNDKVPDRDDLDDDNDGIPDTIEGPCVPIGNPNLVQDGDFENVDIVTSGLDESSNDKTNLPTPGIWKGKDGFIPNWTSAAASPIDYLEIWQNGNYNVDFTNGHRAYSGKQFVEVNASSPLGLYQDVPTTPGTLLRWSFAHRNRYDDPSSDTDDVIDVLIGAPGAAVVQNSFTSAPNYAWTENAGYYTVPAGQTTTRIWFRANVGSNFIDKVQMRVLDACTDADSDGIPNSLDLDSDNDGIPDVLEAGLIDANNDGLVDTTSYGLNGLADNVETFADSGLINYTVRNTDASSDSDPGFVIYDFLDVDSDNDGISDTAEAFSNNTSYNDANNDGRIDGFTDADGNGWHDPIDAGSPFPTLLNSDSDNLPNHRDLDSDGDGIPDTVEGNFGLADADNNGIVGNGIPADDDGDGLANSNDADFPGNILSGSGFNKDRDNDGVLNYLDIDYDNDGIIDNTEAQSTFAYIAPSGSDTDGDGIDDAYDIDNGGFAIGYINTDGGWAPDYADVNSDDDAEFDLVENHFDNSKDVNKDTVNNSNGNIESDGMIDPGEPDTDGDGLVDIFDLVNGVSIIDNATNGGQTPMTQPDLENPGNDRDWREQVVNDNDNDGYSDLNDEDDDNDGILDIVEGGGDADGDGIPLYLDGNDNDPSVLAASTPNPLNDIDGDGLQNSFDLDSDGDGIPDHIEAGGIFDGDGNGTPGTGFLTGADVNSVGVPLQVVAPQPAGFNGDGTDGLNPIDTDLDGLYDFMDLDSDNDGIGDVIEAGGVDPDGNGIYGSGSTNDLDADGFADALDILYNNDNPSTAGNELGTVLGGTPLTVLIGGIHQVKDSDGDGHSDNLDLDSDNDTVPDIVEAQTTLGYIAYNATDSNDNGLNDVYDPRLGGLGIIPVDTDGDGIPDYLDLDSDDDAIFDIVEAHNPAITHTSGRTNGVVSKNGLDDAYELAAEKNKFNDPNGILDETQADNFPDLDQDVLTGGDVDYRDDSFNDFDEDGVADNVDKDDDNDGVLDIDESYGADPLLDADGDGIPNYLDPKFCTGGALNIHGICPEFDLDNDGIPNHFDLDSDGDGCSDALESGATKTVFTADYEFTGAVGTDGVPDAVQGTSGVNSGNVNYTVIKTNPGINDFMDANIQNACSADLELVKTVNDATPKVGDAITFTLTLTNKGPFSVSEVQVKDIIPEGLIGISGSTSSGTYSATTGMWNLSGVVIDPSGAGSIKTLQIFATVGPNCGNIDTIAEIFTSERFDPDSTPNSGD